MNVELIRIDKATAKEKLAAYRKGIAARAHGDANARVRREYEAIEAGYRAAARGLPLIMLSQAMQTGGWDDKGRPRFAVAPALFTKIAASFGGSELVFYDPKHWSGRNVKSRRVFNVRGWAQRQNAWNGGRIEAMVPIVPPDVLKRPDLDLSRRVILWEADWTAPPIDPLLLLPIGGDLFAVEAAWDLTDLERAVIAGRTR